MFDLEKEIVGKKVIIRGRNSGVEFGELVSLNGSTAVLKNSRRLWYWSGAASLTQLAAEGVKNPDECKFSITNPNNHIICDVIEVLECSTAAVININEVKEWRS